MITHIRLFYDRHLATIGASSGIWAWFQSNYPMIKGTIGDIAFFCGAFLAVMGVIDRIKRGPKK